MPRLESDEVVTALTSKLGAVERQKHHRYFYVYDEQGRHVSHTNVSHGSKHTISNSLATQMARQVGLGTAQNLVKLVRCTLGGEEALAIIKQA